MEWRKRTLILISILTLSSFGCGLPSILGAPLFGNPTLVPTYIEQTMEALRQQAEPATPTFTLTPTITPTPTSTPMPVTLNLLSGSKCFRGPGSRFGVVTSIPSGTTITAIGKDTSDGFWIVVDPDDPSQVCWIPGQMVKVTGDASLLPEFLPPTPSLYSLSEPKNLSVSCSTHTDASHGTQFVIVFRWTNTEPNQYGVRVYRNGRWIATVVGPHAGSYTDYLTRRNISDLTYGVQAYNASYVSGIVTIELRRCE